MAGTKPAMHCAKPMLGTHNRLAGSPWSRRSLAAVAALSIALVAGSAAAAPAVSARAPRQPAAVTRQLRLTRKLARRLIVEPRLRAQNERWGWLTHRKALRKAKSQAHRAIDRSIERAHASGTLDQRAAKRLRTSMRGELDQASLDQVMAHEPELATGRRGWWSMLRRVTGAARRPFSRLGLIVDGPEFRTAVHDLVGRADGFLHVSGLEWNNDSEGQAFSQAIAARKLRLKPETLRRLLAKRTLTEIRDRRLAEAFAALELHLPLDAPIPEARIQAQLATIERMPETARRALVGDVLEPLEVRVLLSGMFQLKANRGRPKQPLLADLETVGGHVLFEHMPVQRRFPWFLPQNLYARVTHGKMVVSGDEAIAGGQNFGFKYMQPAGAPLEWHDASAATQGKVVHGYTQSFIAHWNDSARAKGKKELLVDERAVRPASGEKLYYPPPRGPPRGKAAIAGTDERIGTSKATFTYRTGLRLALAGAKESVFVTNPYFTSPWVAGQLADTARRFRREGRDPSRIVLLADQGGRRDARLVAPDQPRRPPAEEARRDGPRVRARRRRRRLHRRRHQPRQGLGGGRQGRLPRQRQPHGQEHDPGLGDGRHDRRPGVRRRGAAAAARR